MRWEKNVGKSLCEKELKDLALEIIQNAKKNNCKILLPIDVAVCKKLEAGTEARNVDVSDITDDEIIADIGPKTAEFLKAELQNYKTLVWNGPLGVFEIKPFNEGTNAVAKIVADLTDAKKLLSVAGGGDVVSALNASGLIDKFSYISTAGGAFLEWLEGKGLPGVDAICGK
jgi:phosphoglycerate kinase